MFIFIFVIFLPLLHFCFHTDFRSFSDNAWSSLTSLKPQTGARGYVDVTFREHGKRVTADQ